MAAERLQKYLARAGVASRRHAEELITAGRVAVNNKTVTELGSRVEPGTDLVTVDGSLVTPPQESSYFLLYKPVGVVTTLSDPQGRATVAGFLEDIDERLFPVGRLDYDAEGALLFTNDGALAHKLTHPSFQVPRTYLAKVKGAPDAATLDKLRGGVRLEDGMATPVSVDVFEAAERNTWLKIVVAEGRPHLIKRLCAAVGHPVVRLFRPSYAGVAVEGMRPGQLRPLKESEVELLTNVSEGRVQPPTGDLRLPPRRHGRSGAGAEGDEDELSMDDDAPAPRKAAQDERPARKTAAGRAKASEGKGAGGSGLARFGRSAGASEGRPARREFGGAGDEGEAPRSSGRPARKTWGGGEGTEARGAGRPARKTWGGGEGGGEGRPARKTWGGGEGGGEGRPARKTWGGGEGTEARGAGRPARKTWGGGEGGADRPARKSWGGGESTEARGAGRPARKTWGGGEGGAERGAGRPARKTFGEGGAARGAGRPARREWGAGGDEGASPRSEGRPARRTFGGGDEGASPRSEGRPARRTFGGGDEGRAPRAGRPERGGFGAGARGAGRPERAGFGAGARGPRGAGRPERREWGGGGDDAPRPRAPRAGGAGRPFGAGARGPRGGGDEGGAPRAGRPVRREFSGGDEGRAPRRTESREFVAGDRPVRRGPGADRPPRREFGGEGRAPRGAGRTGFGAGEGGPRRAAPRSEGAGGRGGARGAGDRPARSTWAPYDASGRPQERVVRGGARRGAGAEGGETGKSGGFQDWSKKKRGPAAQWSSERPRGGAGRPPPRGPRKPR
jgi:23S rRNA pseudouridine2605 synthase